MKSILIISVLITSAKSIYGAGNSTSLDFEDQTCAQSCQLQSIVEISQLFPFPSVPSLSNSSSLNNTDIADILETMKKICDGFLEMKNCTLFCDGGAQSWESFAAEVSTEEIIEQCESGFDFLGIGPMGPAAISEEIICVSECQESSESKIAAAVSVADSESILELSRQTKNICEAVDVLKTCLLSCGQIGNYVWKIAFVNGSIGDSDIQTFKTACYPESKTGGPAEEIPHQCFEGACAKCVDLPARVCNPDYNVYTTKDACVNSGCGEKGKDIPKYNYCTQDGSILEANEDNLNCNPNDKVAQCNPDISCVPLETFGASYCCPDTPEQAQIVCVQKCKAKIASRQESILTLFAKPEAFEEQACVLYNDNKDCILQCPMGEAGWIKYEETEMKREDSTYGSLKEICS